MKAILLSGEVIRDQLFLVEEGEAYALPGWLADPENSRTLLLNIEPGQYEHTCIEEVTEEQLRMLLACWFARLWWRSAGLPRRF